jgi:signal transduction histidine kinase
MKINQIYNWISKFAARWNLVQRFNLAGFIIMVLGTVVIGRWVADQIKFSIVNESAATTALYLDSFVTPNLQELEQSDSLTPKHSESLNNLLQNTDLGRQIVAIKVWNHEGRILYSDHPSMINRVFEIGEDLDTAFQGRVFASISDLQDPENVEEQLLYSRLLEIYIPVRKNGAHKVIAVAEFYEKVDALDAEIAKAQRQSWLAVSAGMGFTYLFLVGFFRWARNRIEKQEVALKNQVAQLTEVLSQNDELDQRVRRATANAATLNERFLRRIGTELTNGPMKEISLALSQLEIAVNENKVCRLVNQNSMCNENLPIVQTSLQTSLQEISAITSGLQLPQLESLTLSEIFNSAVKAHEMRTRTYVDLQMSNLPDEASLSTKIVAYRIVQEGLNNAHRHAGGVGQAVRVMHNLNELQIDVSDQGPGFDITLPVASGTHLGLAGMRERVKSLGGLFSVESKINEGTKIITRLFLSNTEAFINE